MNSHTFVLQESILLGEDMWNAWQNEILKKKSMYDRLYTIFSFNQFFGCANILEMEKTEIGFNQFQNKTTFLKSLISNSQVAERC